MLGMFGMNEKLSMLHLQHLMDFCKLHSKNTFTQHTSCTEQQFADKPLLIKGSWAQAMQNIKSISQHFIKLEIFLN